MDCSIDGMPNKDPDPKLPLSELGSAEAYNAARKNKGISPIDPNTMPRAEDDKETYERSPEYHDRPDAGK